MKAVHAVPAPGKPTPEAPHLHINNVNAYHAGDENGYVVLIKPRMSGRSAALAGLARQVGPAALERLEDEGFVRFDDPA